MANPFYPFRIDGTTDTTRAEKTALASDGVDGTTTKMNPAIDRVLVIVASAAHRIR
jgi:hypothetical protein